ncbi:MAG: Hsp20/alpha crystallin family protein [Chloroflexi bacterium]|nr:Hsp20/alpha crystallin family protein [Chloroflexota bacterium]
MAVERWRPRWSLRAWEPFREMEEEMERFFEEWPFRGRPPFPWSRRALMAREWTPRVDMFDREDKVIVKVELPGVKREDIDVSVVGGVLTIKGERKGEENVRDEDYYCCERFRGSFYRAIQLPTEVDADRIEATYADGILEITLPKVPEIKPKKVSITIK